MDKVTYASDTTAAVPGAALSAARYDLAATGNSTNGYFGGGRGPGGRFSTMNKITYSSDTTAAVPGANLSLTRGGVAAAGNLTNGYFGGGYTGAGTSPYSSTMDKVTYSSDTTAAVPGAALSVERSQLSAAGNSTIGYFGGGTVVGNDYSTVDKITYSSDTRTSTITLSTGSRFNAATGSSTAGYFSMPSNPALTMDTIQYSTDTRSSVPGAKLSVFRQNLAATSARANGATVTPDPPAATPTPVTSPVLAPAPNTGYFGGGLPGARSTMDKVTYSSDTTAAVPGAALSAARYSLAATGNSTAGYFGGGATPAAVSTMDKVTYATDTTAAVPGAALSVGRQDVAATGSSTAGYFGGGRVPARSTMDKVTYSSDTTVQVPGASLSAARYGVAATGNTTAGYFGGGRNSTPIFTTMDKLTYSSDTTAVVPGAGLITNRLSVGAAGNSTAGYFGGGEGGSPVQNRSTMDKVTYSSDTTAAVPGAFISSPRNFVAATGNSTAGYFGGGSPSSSTMDKIDYATDTRLSAIPGASLSAARYAMGASSALANALPSTYLAPTPNIV